MKSQSHHFRRGNVTVLGAVMSVMLVAMLAFSIDVGYIVHAKTELQRTADSCALAAVARLPHTAMARKAAEDVADYNKGSVGPRLTIEDVQFGHWDRDAATFSSYVPAGYLLNAARVTVRRTEARGNPLQLFFSRILGRPRTDVLATATAMYDYNLCGPFIGIEWISAPGGPLTDSFDSREGPYSSATARDRGSLCSDGPIELEGTTTINGDARAGKGFQVAMTSNVVVTGSIGSRLKPLNLPTVDVSKVAQKNDNHLLPLIQKGNSFASPLDADRNFLLDGSKTYDLPGGTYYFNNVSLSGQAVLNLKGPTKMYVTGNFYRGGGVKVNQNTTKAAEAQILMTGGIADITSDNPFYGVIYSPRTDLTIDGNAEYFGAVVGRTLTLTGGATGHYDEALEMSDLAFPGRTTLVD